MQDPPQVSESSSQRNKLVKKNPPPTYRSRAASDGGSQRHSQGHYYHHQHQRSPTSPSSPETNSHTSIDATIGSRTAYQPRSDTSYRIEGPQTDSEKDRSDLFGERFDSAAILSNLNAVTYPTDPPPQASPQLRQQQSEFNSLHPPHPLNHTQSESRVALANPNIRLSESLAATGRQMDEITQPRGGLGSRDPGQRLSDEAKEAKLKKKSGLSSVWNNLVGSPRKPMISAPENPVHVTHVGYDQETGEFTVRWDCCRTNARR